MSRGELLSILQSVVGNYVPPAMKIDWYVLTTYQTYLSRV